MFLPTFCQSCRHSSLTAAENTAGPDATCGLCQGTLTVTSSRAYDWMERQHFVEIANAVQQAQLSAVVARQLVADLRAALGNEGRTREVVQRTLERVHSVMLLRSTTSQYSDSLPQVTEAMLTILGPLTRVELAELTQAK